MVICVWILDRYESSKISALNKSVIQSVFFFSCITLFQSFLELLGRGQSNWSLGKLCHVNVWLLLFSHSAVSDSLRLHGLKPTWLLCPWDSPGKNTGVSCHFLLQGIFPTQGSNPGLFHWQMDSLPLSQCLVDNNKKAVECMSTWFPSADWNVNFASR